MNMIFGNKGCWQVLYEIEEKESTKIVSAMEIQDVGCIVETTVYYGKNPSISNCFVPKVRIQRTSGKNKDNIVSAQLVRIP